MTESKENEEWRRAIFIQTLHVPTHAQTHLHAYLAVCPGPWTSWRVQTRDRWWLVNSLSTSNTLSIRIKFGVSCTMEKIYSLSHSNAVQKNNNNYKKKPATWRRWLVLVKYQEFTVSLGIVDHFPINLRGLRRLTPDNTEIYWKLVIRGAFLVVRHD